MWTEIKHLESDKLDIFSMKFEVSDIVNEHV